ncbi:MAG: hypothetical protein KDB52_02300 [Solirubrobacterales bacterium]|nr:hypothetical protein [Solirubrobacterales bacterium]
MEREHLVRNDFPLARGAEGFDVDSVGAHLAAVAAHAAALEARITSLELERDKLREQLRDAREHQSGPTGMPDPKEPEAADEGEVAARLLASKLAMGGTSRDTIVMQVAATHDVANPAALVDDVLARLT